MTIGERLKEERERLKMSQTEFGDVGGMGKTTVIAWEKGNAYPNAAFLADIAAIGADINYILAGQRSFEPPPQCSKEEEVLLDNFRNMAQQDRAHYKAIGSSLAQSKDVKKKAG